MSYFHINLISLGVAFIIIFSYAVYVWLFQKKPTLLRNNELKERLKLAKSVPNVQKSKTALSLLKDKEIHDTYFKSKLDHKGGFQSWLAHSGLTLSVPLFLGICGGLAMLIIAALLVVLRVDIIGACALGGGIAVGGPWLFIKVLTSRRKSLFLQQLPSALDMIKRAVRVGHSVDKALEMVAEQQNDLVGQAFRQIVDRMKLGESAEVVLSQLSNKLGIEAFHMLAIVLVLQRETGGSLAEAVENFSKILVAKQALKKKISALTGEVKASALIMIAIPILIFIALYTISPLYMEPLIYTPRGHKILMFVAMLLGTGVTLIGRMVFKDTY